MISYLSSKFSRASRRAVCLTADTVTVYHWQAEEITDSFQFDMDDTGRFHFGRYLQETPVVPTYILVDVVEEEFRQDTIPHIMGPDRKNLINRKLSRNFRNTPYVHYMMQGREKEGRKDDKVLLTALTNQKIITPWVETLEKYQIPLAGIFSLPILSKSLLKPLKANTSNVLLVSMSGSGGLRQTYFRDQEIQISRLARLPRFGTAPYGPYIKSELEKIYRYLNNMRWVSREEPLDIYILAHGELMSDLAGRMIDTGLTRYHLIDVAAFSRKTGVEAVLTTPFSDYLFAHLLLSKTPENHYATPDNTHYFSMHSIRSGLFAASTLLLLIGTGWSGYNFIKGVSLKQQSLEAEQKTAFYQSRYDIAKKDLPPTAVDPSDIQSAINIIDSLLQHKTTPFLMMNTLSRSLNRFPTLQLDKIQWVADVEPSKHLKAEQENSLTEDEEQNFGDYPYYQIATVEGHLTPFDGNFRRALGLVKRFANAIEEGEHVKLVKIDRLPLDISSQSRLSGEMDQENNHDAAFVVTIVMGVNHET